MAKYAPLRQPVLSEAETIIGRNSDEPELESFLPPEKHDRSCRLKTKYTVLLHGSLILGNLLVFFLYASSYSFWAHFRARDLHCTSFGTLSCFVLTEHLCSRASSIRYWVWAQAVWTQCHLPAEWLSFYEQANQFQRRSQACAWWGLEKSHRPYGFFHAHVFLNANAATDQAFRVPEEELGQFSGQKNLVQLSDGSGYYFTLAVFHGLHCVQRLHHFIHRDTYYDGISEADFIRLKSHTGVTWFLIFFFWV